MSEVTAPSLDSEVPSAQVKIEYQVAMPEPQNHLFEVTLQLSNYSSPVLDLKLPVWTPGSYLVREYAKHLQDFRAFAANQALSWRKVSKNHWQVEMKSVSQITIKYRIFANELTVRTNHLDPSHGYFNGAATFFRIPGLDKQEINVTIIPPSPDWRVTTGLPPVPEEENTFLAADFDTLVDSPFEIGNHQLHHFEALGKPHELAIWGYGNLKAQRVIADLQRIITVEANMFGGLPYDRYIFFVHLFAQAYGGLEHKNSCCLIYPRFGFRDREKYERFMQLAAHEFFHLWNVKRIRPKALEVFDYDRENYTPSLWFCEGATSYYDLLIPYRAGIYSVTTYINNLSKDITKYEQTPGRRVQPVSESSFDAWIKLYRQDSNSGNSQISYYLKGELICLLLDLLIRAQHNNKRSFDDVMVQMWEKFGKAEIGYTPEQLQEVIESVADTQLYDFFQLYIHKCEDLPFNQYLEPFGLRLLDDLAEEPYLGIRLNNDSGRGIIKFVEAGAPAQLAGIEAADELLAIDGLKVTASQLSDRLKDYKAGDTIQVTVFHQDELRNFNVTLASPRANKYYLKPIKNPSSTQQENFAGWLGTALTNVR